MRKLVASVQDICCFGKCSMTLTLPVLAALSHTAVPIPTALYSTHLGYEGHTLLPLGTEAKKIIAHYQQLGLRFDACISGFLSDESQVQLVADVQKMVQPTGLHVTDPVLGDYNRLYRNVTDGMLDGIRVLCESADLITPNVSEACWLLHIPYTASLTMDSAEQILHALSHLGKSKSAVLTGCDMLPGYVSSLSMQPHGEVMVHHEPRVGGNWHGCGDLFVAALTGLLLQGASLSDAVAKSSHFVARCVQHSEACHAVEAEGLLFEPLLSALCQEGGNA